MSERPTAIIIGAGPAGLTAALELCERSDIRPIVLEGSDEIGGISRTVNHGGNRMDIGGHRFFSKSDEVMQWWTKILPIQQTDLGAQLTLKYQGKTRQMEGGPGADPEVDDEVMLVRSRLSRIYFGGHFYSYPVTMDVQTIKNMGFMKLAKSGLSYLKARIKPLKEESLEDFYVNRFGRELYNQFFRDYTEKVWGVPCKDIDPSWGAQRVKGLSITKTLMHAGKKMLESRKPAQPTDISQKNVETSLIEYFLYPKLGPGQLWETVARKVTEGGGEVRKNQVVTAIRAAEGKVLGVDVMDRITGEKASIDGDYFFSTMAVKDLIEGLHGVDVPANVHEIASTLPYRDFITVGVLAKQLKIRNETDRDTKYHIVPDNWIYVQDPGVKLGRIQIFNNWSPWLVQDERNVWMGLEYFCAEGDEMWTMPDDDFANFAIKELETIGVVDPAEVVDHTVVHVKKTYPAYFGSYLRFDEVREFTDKFENLFLIGRNGQHRYNNQDHSMLTAIRAVDQVIAGKTDKDPVWNVNVEQEYHEEK